MIVPSAESVAQSKVLLLASHQQATEVPKRSVGHSSKAKAAQRVAVPEDAAERHGRQSAEKARQPAGGSLLIASADKHSQESIQKSDRLTNSDAKSNALQVRLSSQKPESLSHMKAEQSQDLEGLSDACFSADDQADQELQNSSKRTSFISHKYEPAQGLHSLNVIEERLESQESALSDPNLSPRSKHILKLQKKIKFSFMKSGYPPET